MTRYFLGVDIGNTKSHALICDEEGQAVGVGFAGSGNHEHLGKDGFAAVLASVVEDAGRDAGIPLNLIAAAGYGIAGFDWPEDLPLMQEVIEGLPMRIPYGVMNDSGIGLVAGSRMGWGVSVSAGTSANARGRDASGREARMTGNSLRFGEYGGGNELVFRSIQSISRAWSMRGPQTSLSERFVEYVGAEDVDDFLAGLARGRYSARAKAAPIVFEAARSGDRVAQDNIRWIASGLADLACGIIRQLGIQDLEFDVVLSGSIFHGSSLILETMTSIVVEIAPRARFVHLSAPPVTGAVMLGMEQVNLDYLPLRERIIETGNQLLLRHRVDNLE